MSKQMTKVKKIFEELKFDDKSVLFTAETINYYYK